MKISKNLISRFSAVLTALMVVVPSAQSQNILDPAGIFEGVFGGPVIGNGTVTFAPPRIDKIPDMLRNLPPRAALYFLNPAGGALSIKIRQARENARANCGPVPQNVIDSLTPFLPLSVFDGLCWTVLQPGLGIDTVVIQDGGRVAVTLVDTIVFKNRESGFDPGLWAHELIHVLQYRRMGVEGFANMYSFNWNGLEKEAYDFEGFVESRLSQQSAGTGFQGAYYRTQQGWDPNAQIPNETWMRQARATIDPLKCTDSQTMGNSDGSGMVSRVINNCPVSLHVVTFSVTNLQTGQTSTFPCQGSCDIPADYHMDYPNQPGFKLTSIYATWLQN
jgi:hypothetical protein